MYPFYYYNPDMDIHILIVTINSGYGAIDWFKRPSHLIPTMVILENNTINNVYYGRHTYIHE